jgi:hypothetical protein
MLLVLPTLAKRSRRLRELSGRCLVSLRSDYTERLVRGRPHRAW